MPSAVSLLCLISVLVSATPAGMATPLPSDSSCENRMTSNSINTATISPTGSQTQRTYLVLLRSSGEEVREFLGSTIEEQGYSFGVEFEGCNASVRCDRAVVRVRDGEEGVALEVSECDRVLSLMETTLILSEVKECSEERSIVIVLYVQQSGGYKNIMIEDTLYNEDMLTI